MEEAAMEQFEAATIHYAVAKILRRRLTRSTGN